MENSGRTSGNNIKCPKCGEFFPITETIQEQLAERTRTEMKREQGASLKPISALDSADPDSVEQIGLALAAAAEDVAS
jgi:hypothetical protein